MGLANVQVSLPHFEQLHAHLTTHNRRCQNMHLRATYPGTRPAQMRHLHAAFASGDTEIAGMISGHGVLCEYRMLLVRGQPQMRVLTEEGDEQEIERIQHQFLRAVVRRMREEAASDLDHPVNRIEGQLYLKRLYGGMSPDHQLCRNAIESGALDRRFVDRLAPWNLALFLGPPQRTRSPRRPRQ
ncbi:MAG TPA: hypothetical protein VGG39_06095 [Polyangiaceae bacterium]|jgi:hypothetical protein